MASALSRHHDPARALHFPDAQRWIGSPLGHLELLDRPDVYDVIRHWLTA